MDLLNILYAEVSDQSDFEKALFEILFYRDVGFISMFNALEGSHASTLMQLAHDAGPAKIPNPFYQSFDKVKFILKGIDENKFQDFLSAIVELHFNDFLKIVNLVKLKRDLSPQKYELLCLTLSAQLFTLLSPIIQEIEKQKKHEEGPFKLMGNITARGRRADYERAIFHFKTLSGSPPLSADAQLQALQNTAEVVGKYYEIKMPSSEPVALLPKPFRKGF